MSAAVDKEAKKLAQKREKEAKKLDKEQKKEKKSTKEKISIFGRRKTPKSGAPPAIQASLASGSTSASAPIWYLALLDDKTFPLVEKFINQCLSWLKAHQGYEKEGLFRKTGSEKRIVELQKAVDSGRLEFTDDEDEHVVATLLKRFFRDMKEPLLTFDLYETFLGAVVSDGQERIENVRKALKILPEKNRRVLELLMSALSEVTKFSSVNFMTPQNLAIVFAPNLLRPRVETPMTMISDSAAVNNLVSSLVKDFATYFPPGHVAPATVAPPSDLPPPLPSPKPEDADISTFRNTMRIKHLERQSTAVSLLQEIARKTRLSQDEVDMKLASASIRIKSGNYDAFFAALPDGETGQLPYNLSHHEKSSTAVPRSLDLFHPQVSSEPHQTPIQPKSEPVTVETPTISVIESNDGAKPAEVVPADSSQSIDTAYSTTSLVEIAPSKTIPAPAPKLGEKPPEEASGFLGFFFNIFNWSEPSKPEAEAEVTEELGESNEESESFSDEEYGSDGDEQSKGEDLSDLKAGAESVKFVLY